MRVGSWSFGSGGRGERLHADVDLVGIVAADLLGVGLDGVFVKVGVEAAAQRFEIIGV